MTADQSRAALDELARIDEELGLTQAPAEAHALSRLDWDSMCGAFSRVIEAHAHKDSPFHDPINADATLALRELRHALPAIKAFKAQPKGSDKANEWRKLAQQFDGQRMAAMVHLRTLLAMPQAHADAARAFLAATPTEQIASVAPVQSPAPAPEAASAARPFSVVKSFSDSVLAMLDERIKAVDQAAHPFNDYFGDQPETIAAAKAQAGELREVRTQVRILGDRALVDLMKFRPAISAPAVQDEKTPAGYNRPPNGEPAHPDDWNAGYEAGLADGHEAGLHSGKLAVAWMYEHDGSLDEPILTASRWPECREPWNETPLDALALAKHAIEKVWLDAVGTSHGEHSISEAARKRVEFAADALKLGLRLPGALRNTGVESPIHEPAKGDRS